MNQSRSIAKYKRNVSSSPIKSAKASSTIESDYYYCHFRNAMYMGGIKAFQKHGRGIVIHDDGTSAVTEYLNDFRNGHNIYYSEHSILSTIYHKNRLTECVIRTSHYLLLVRFDKDQFPHGKAVLINFKNRKIFYARYKKGSVVEKTEEFDSSIVNRIIDLGNIEYIIGDFHSSAINFDIQRDRNIASQKASSRFQAGFYKKGLLNGLGFVLTTGAN